MACLVAKNRLWTWRKRTERSRRQVKRISELPDDVLLEIFDSYMKEYLIPPPKRRVEPVEVEAWQSLVHVCRRWRSLVLGSPRHLNLQLFFTPKTRARDKLDIWPTLRLIVAGNMALSSSSATNNVIAVLGQNNHVCQVDLWNLAGWQLREVLAAMQVPFPELTDLGLESPDPSRIPVIPDSFLGGSAPHLQYFSLCDIPFPGLPKLLLSATRLVSIELFKIPHSGYIPPEAIVAPLCALSSLETLCLEFRSPQSRPDRESRSLPPPKRSILPALYQFRFRGVTEYLEDLVTFIDAPQLNYFYITFLNQIDIDTPRLAQFINRTPTLRALDEADVQFDNCTASVKLRCRTSMSSLYNLLINIPGYESHSQLSSVTQVCHSSLPPLSVVEDLYVKQISYQVWKNGAMENTLLLRLLLPFTAVKNLYLSKKFASGIAPALRQLVESRRTQVLPSLQNIFVEELGC